MSSFDTRLLLTQTHWIEIKQTWRATRAHKYEVYRGRLSQHAPNGHRSTDASVKALQDTP